MSLNLEYTTIINVSLRLAFCARLRCIMFYLLVTIFQQLLSANVFLINYLLWNLTLM